MDKKKKVKQTVDAPKQAELKKINPPRIESTPMKFWKDENGELKLELDEKVKGHPVNSVTGCKDIELSSEIVLLTVNAISQLMDKKETAMNVVLQSIHDFKPQNAVEARLVAQATAAFQYAMKGISRSGSADMLCQIEAMANIAIKFMRVHNETIETLSRLRRGGEQKVTVTHIAEKMAVVNNFGVQGGGGDIQENKGETSCQQSAGQKPEQTTIPHVDSPQWLMGDVAYTEGKVPAQRRKKVAGA